MIINHLSIGTSDVNRAIEFYDAVLLTLGVTRTHYIENVAAAYGEHFEFWVGSPYEGKATKGNGTHIAFNAATPSEVDAFYRVAIQCGGQCAGSAGYRKEYGDNYYAAYIFDLDGNKIEAVSM